MIHLQQLRYEQLKSLATRCNIVTVRDAQNGAAHAHPAFRAIEHVLRELFILQRRYMLHLDSSEVDRDLPLVRVLLKLSFNTGGKAKVNALIQELREHNDSLERTLTLCNHPKSRDPHLEPCIRVSPTGYHVHTTSHVQHSDNERECGFQAVSHSTPSHQPTTNTHFPSYSSQSSHQVTPTVGRPTSILYARASPSTPSNATNIASWFGSTRSYISRERDDNCSGPLHRAYSSSSSQD